MTTLLSLADVTTILDPPTAPDELRPCIHCERIAVEVVEYFDHGACEVVTYERCLFCGRTQ